MQFPSDVNHTQFDHYGRHRIARRDLLMFGSLGILGLPSTALAAPQASERIFGKAKSLLFISLLGGPSHIDLWDMKPDASAEVRGEFQPIATRADGIRFCEHLPKLAQIAPELALVRSVTHEDNGHGSAMYTAFTGRPHPRPNTNPLPAPDDLPAYGAAVSCFKPSGRVATDFVVLGASQQVCGNNVPGQRAGLLGPAYEPFVIEQSPAAADFRVPELSPRGDVPAGRLERRKSLLTTVENELLDRDWRRSGLDEARRKAFDLLDSRDVRRAVDIQQEPDKTRDTYGRTNQGQSLLLARRLLEAQVPCVTVIWAPFAVWDNHAGVFHSLKNALLPTFDQSVSALITDLKQRGLLDQTLVILTGEFGRSPKINKDAGRDHWAGCYTVLFAGGGTRGGVVHGESDPEGAYPKSDPVSPADIAATVYHCLGIRPETAVRDALGRPLALCEGAPVHAIL